MWIFKWIYRHKAQIKSLPSTLGQVLTCLILRYPRNYTIHTSIFSLNKFLQKTLNSFFPQPWIFICDLTTKLHLPFLPPAANTYTLYIPWSSLHIIDVVNVTYIIDGYDTYGYDTIRYLSIYLTQAYCRSLTDQRSSRNQIYCSRTSHIKPTITYCHIKQNLINLVTRLERSFSSLPGRPMRYSRLKALQQIVSSVIGIRFHPRACLRRDRC